MIFFIISGPDLTFYVAVLGINLYWAGLVNGFMFYVLERPKAHQQWLWFKKSQKTGARLRVSSDRLGEPGIELGTLGYIASGLCTTPRRLTILI